jgi:hypothetical protein
MASTKTLRWVDSVTPDCTDCLRLLYNPLFGELFYGSEPRTWDRAFSQAPDPRGMRRLARFHIDDHQLRPIGDGY